MEATENKRSLNSCTSIFPLPFSFTFFMPPTPPHHTTLISLGLSFRNSVSPFKIKDGKCKEETKRSTASKATQKTIAGFQYSLLFTQNLWWYSPFDIVFTWMSLHLFSIPRGEMLFTVQQISIPGNMMTSLIIASRTLKEKSVFATLLRRYYFGSFHLSNETTRYL